MEILIQFFMSIVKNIQQIEYSILNNNITIYNTYTIITLIYIPFTYIPEF